MSTSSLPVTVTPTSLIERLVRDHTQVTLDSFQGFPLIPYRNGYAHGFIVGVEVQDLGGLVP